MKGKELTKASWNCGRVFSVEAEDDGVAYTCACKQITHDFAPECNAVQTLYCDGSERRYRVLFEMAPPQFSLLMPKGLMPSHHSVSVRGSFLVWRSILVDVARQLRHMWRVGFTHGDVTPANIMIEHVEGGDVRASLVDFGRARIIGTSGFQRKRDLLIDFNGFRCMTLCASLGELFGIVDYNTPAADAYALGMSMVLNIIGFKVCMEKVDNDLTPNTAWELATMYMLLRGTLREDDPLRGLLEHDLGPELFEEDREDFVVNKFAEKLRSSGLWSEEDIITALTIISRLLNSNPDERMRCIDELIGVEEGVPFSSAPSIHPSLIVAADSPDITLRRIPDVMKVCTSDISVLHRGDVRATSLLAMSHFLVVREEKDVVGEFSAGLDVLVAAMSILQAYDALCGSPIRTSRPLMEALVECVSTALCLTGSPCMEAMPRTRPNTKTMGIVYRAAQKGFAEFHHDTLLEMTSIHGESGKRWRGVVCASLGGHVLPPSRMPRLGAILDRVMGGETGEVIRMKGVPVLMEMVADNDVWNAMFADREWCEHIFESKL